jgi:hypothetical protein
MSGCGREVVRLMDCSRPYLGCWRAGPLGGEGRGTSGCGREVVRLLDRPRPYEWMWPLGSPAPGPLLSLP